MAFSDVPSLLGLLELHNPSPHILPPARRTPTSSPQISLHLEMMAGPLHSPWFLSQASYKPLGLSQAALAGALLF